MSKEFQGFLSLTMKRKLLLNGHRNKSFVRSQNEKLPVAWQQYTDRQKQHKSSVGKRFTEAAGHTVRLYFTKLALQKKKKKMLVT